MDPKTKSIVLCVDDEPSVLEGLSLTLGRRFTIMTATSGAEALALLEGDIAPAVVMSDMRMPSMDGATFLARAREVTPDAVRILLTGQADLDSAIAAVNNGQIFRFLNKPCPPPDLIAAVEAAVELHRLITSERVLLEETLHGSIKTLTDVLALTNPVAFGRATRIKQAVTALATSVGMRELWQLEVAAMLSHLGYIILPAETVEKVYYGRPLSQDEQDMVSRVPATTERLLGHIPRLEVVRGILARYARPVNLATSSAADAEQQLIARGAGILKVALAFDTLEAQGNAVPLALDTMRGRAGLYDAEALAALVTLHSGVAAPADVREVSATGLCVGMIVVADVKLKNGTLLVTRGYEVTESFIERVRNYPAGTIVGQIRVSVPADDAEAAA